MWCAHSFSLAVLWLAAAGQLAAQSAGQGDLLVASSEMADSSFARSVLLLLRHDDEGSLGVLINRPTTLAPAVVFDELEAIGDYDGTLFYGGPVLPTRLLLLLRDPPAVVADGAVVFGGVFVSGNPSVLTRAPEWAAQRGNLRLYAGHAVWEPGQLDAEIADGQWIVTDGRAELVFSEDPLELWQRALGAESEAVVDAR